MSGIITCTLTREQNFLALCASGAYDNTLFHRVIPGFMVQGGDPTGTGKGGRAWNGDFLKDEFHASLRVHFTIMMIVHRRRSSDWVAMYRSMTDAGSLHSPTAARTRTRPSSTSRSPRRPISTIRRPSLEGSGPLWPRA